MNLFQRLTARRSNDPYWDGFVNRPLADPAHDVGAAIRNAPEGHVFPVKSEVPPPGRMSRDLAELARFFGALRMGVAATNMSHLRAETSKAEDIAALAATHPFLIVCAVPAEYDPAAARGMAGRVAVQKSASLNFNIAAYIRELGYQGTVRPVDSLAVAVAAGLGVVGKDGRLSVPGHGPRAYVGDAVLTDLPLVTGSPAL